MKEFDHELPKGQAWADVTSWLEWEDELEEMKQDMRECAWLIDTIMVDAHTKGETDIWHIQRLMHILEDDVSGWAMFSRRLMLGLAIIAFHHGQNHVPGDKAGLLALICRCAQDLEISMDQLNELLSEP